MRESIDGKLLRGDIRCVWGWVRGGREGYPAYTYLTEFLLKAGQVIRHLLGDSGGQGLWSDIGGGSF